MGLMFPAGSIGHVSGWLSARSDIDAIQMLDMLDMLDMFEMLNVKWGLPPARSNVKTFGSVMTD